MSFRLCVPLVLTAACSIYAATPLSLKVGNEIQPPGGVVQMKVFLTEPKPISTGRGRMGISVSLASGVDGVSLFSARGDAAGAAVVSGTQVRMICIVPSTVLGSNPDFPLVTLTSNVRADAALGSNIALSIKPSNLVLLDQNGVPYQEEINSGSLTIANNVSITDVNPGAAAVPAGGKVIISGLNFTPATKVRIKEINLSRVTYVSPTEMDVIVAAPVAMQGQEIIAQNQDGTSAVYYSFQRTTLLGHSASDLFNSTLPLFENRFWTSAAFFLPADTPTTYSGLAVQNLQSAAASIRVSLIASNGDPLAKRVLSLATNRRLVRRLTDLISIPPPPGSRWLVQSNLPVQMLGLNGDTIAGTVAPVLPSATQ